MAKPVGPAVGILARVPPLVLFAVGAFIAVAIIVGLRDLGTPDAAPWWTYVLLLVPAVALATLGAAVTVDPRPLAVRRALAGTALAWLLVLAPSALLRASEVGIDAIVVALVVLAIVDAAALLALAATTPGVSPDELPGPLGRLGAVVVFTVAVVAASIAVVVVVAVALAVWRAIVLGTVSERLPWGAVVVVLLLPAVSFAIATFGTRRGAGATFQAQAAVVGLGAALGADRFGSQVILESAGAHLADPAREIVLLDVVREVSLAAGLPQPRVHVIEDGSQNAFATGRDPANASIAVTRGLLQRLDREELQGVIGHEMGHVRNLDTRYALYVAVLVGLVALVTDGFLRAIVETWRRGGFFWTGGDDIKGAIGAFVSGILVGLFLLAVAAILRVAAPLFSLLVQAAVSRQREFLADATSVELTRNPRGLERALADMAGDRDELEAANRGTQHLWFRNPVKAGSDRRPGILSTHPSIGARIGRLQRLRGIEPDDAPPPIALDRQT